MADEKVVGISFDLEFDLGKIKKSINTITEKVNTELTGAFEKSTKKCNDFCENMSKSFKKTNTDISKEISEVDANIQKILADTEKTMKSKVSSIAWIYRKQGMSQSEAMKKAWSDIERTTEKGSEEVKKDINGIGSKTKNTAKTMESAFGNSFKKIAALLAAAFSVRQLISFGKQCLELGSDLQEVQNVVDVTFPSMSSQIDKFAKNAAGQFGLSETMAKKFSGTFGSMAQAFGFSEKEAYKMSTALTGLAGDVASFYNISQDEAYTKLKSVFSGETETLKDLGIVMTQSALDAYALANGYGKVTTKMTEAEKVSLRFAFVQNQLANATGDFARTSNSWANQTKILSLQFDSLKASIGQGLINAFTPVIRVVNTLLSKLQTLGNAFKNLTENVFGNAGSSNSAAESTSDAMSTASDASDTVASNTKKAAKEAKKLQASVMGFDSLNKLNSTDTSDTDSSSGGAGGSGGTIGITADVDTEEIDKATGKVEKLKNAFIALKDNFVKGFKIGLGDTSVLDSIKGNLASIKESFLEIASNKGVQASLGNLFLTMAESAGKVAGSLSSIALTITDNLTGGISKYLEQNKTRIKESLVSIFDCRAEISKLVSDLCVSLADIFTVFRSDDAKQITADYIKVFSDAFWGLTELSAKYGRDIVRVMSQPITENAGKIKKALSNTLKPVKKVFNTISTSVEQAMDKINQVYDEKIGPALQSLAKGITNVVGTLVDNYNKHVVPVLDDLSKEFDKVWRSIQPVFNKAVDLIGNIASCLSAFWSNILAPLIQWLIDTLVPVVMPILKQVWKFSLKVLGGIGTAIGGLLGILNGIIKFLTGVFKTDWKKAWSDVKSIFSNMKQKIVDEATKLKSKIKVNFAEIKNDVTEKVSGVKTKAVEIWTGMKDKAVEISGSMKSKISEKIKGLKTSFVNTFTDIKKKTSSIFSSLWNTGIKGTINSILSGIETMANGVIKGFNSMIKSINNLGFKMPDWLPKKWANKELGFNIKTLGNVSIPKLANGGYVKANTPQLAMIGDNQHQGEVVAPEDKLQSMVDSAVQQNTDNIISALREIFQGMNKGGNIELVVNIGSKKIMQTVLKAANAGNKRMGKTVYNV